MNRFVVSYNKSVNRYTNSVITYSEAEAIFKEKVIKIKFLTSFTYQETKNGIMDSFVQSTFTQLLMNEKLSKELINEGVSFNVLFLTKNAQVFSSLLVDKNKLNELNKKFKEENKGKINQVFSENPRNYNSIQEILRLLNKNLPLLNKETGFTIMKIDVNPANELLYEIKVPNNIASRIKGLDSADMLKEDMLRDGLVVRLFESVKKLGIKKIKYHYRDNQNKFLNEVILTTADLNH